MASTAYPSPQSTTPYAGSVAPQPHAYYGQPAPHDIKIDPDQRYTAAVSCDGMLRTVPMGHAHTSPYSYERREALKATPPMEATLEKYNSMVRECKYSHK